MKTHLNPANHDAVFEYIPDDKPSEFWVITAYNPDGEDTESADNIVVDKRLHMEIAALGFTPFRIIGMSRDEFHVEPGWGIPCDEITALEIGRRYRQVALFHFRAGSIDLVDCETRKRHPLDDPEARKLDPREVRHFTLFVGSAPGCEKTSSRDYENIRDRIGERFPGFTLQNAEGCFRSDHEASLLVHISTREAESVIRLAHDLRRALNQTGIGISHNGIYQRVREWTDDGLILQSFGIVAPHPLEDTLSNPI